MTAAYEPAAPPRWQPGLVAAALALGVWSHAGSRSLLVLISGGVLMVGWRRLGPVCVVLLVVALWGGGAVGGRAWSSTQPRHLGPYSGWATVIEDPVPSGSGMRTVLEIDGERFRASVWGAKRHRLAPYEAGERLVVTGVREPLAGRFPRRAQVRHIVGELRIERFGDRAAGTPLARASNRVRGQLRSGADRTLHVDDAALFTGLVIGDDARQQPATIDAFRTVGMSHLTAVSGQNVSYVIALAGLLVRRLPRWWRLIVTLGLIGWFAVITRLEPSVLRAGAMAALSATAFAMGRERSPTRLLSLAVIGLLLIDPLLLWSVAFWLSTGATLGVTAIAPAIERRLGGPRWLAAPVAVTAGAQLGVLVPSLLVFGRLPVLGLFANLLAVPVAGFVMLYGLPAGLLAGALPAPLAELVMLPAELGTRWVAVVARLTAVVQPVGIGAAGLWAVQIGAIALLCWTRWRHTTVAVER